VNPVQQARQPAQEPSQQITALYQTHALGFVRLAFVMTGSQPTAEDIVQDAFLGLHRRWDTLVDQDKALSYVRSCVLNGCRQVHRVKYRQPKFRLDPPQGIESAEDSALLGEANRAVLAAIRRLPTRQREARCSLI
jgi:RNA polymerase sigma factor (sigma-70 family)